MLTLVCYMKCSAYCRDRYSYRLCEGKADTCDASITNFNYSIFHHIESGLKPCTTYLSTLHAATEAGLGPAKSTLVITTSARVICHLDS